MNYSKHIFNIFTHMNERRTQVLPENRYWVEYYLRKVWQIAYELFASFRWPTNLPDWLEEKFKDYVTYEEERIRKNLKDVHYDIDALDTVSIVAGPGRIEKVRPSASCHAIILNRFTCRIFSLYYIC